jgi:CheY-like chemotaxis protein
MPDGTLTTAAVPRGQPPSGVEKRRILVVDDNHDSAATMAKMLEVLGNEVLTAHEGTEAVDVAERFRPRVILMDINMLGLNGYEATRRIRSHSWGRDIVVTALTGWGQESDRERSREAGCAATSSNPYTSTTSKHS